MPKKVFLFLTTLLTLLLTSNFLQAQNLPPDVRAGIVQRELDKFEPKAMPPEREVPELEVPPSREELVISEKETVFIEGFDFQGNTLFSSEFLADLLSDYTGKKLSFLQMREAANLITAQYRREAYFLAVAYLPEQEIRGGILTMVIQEGKLGKVMVEGEKNYKEEFINSHFRPTKQGLLNYHELIKSVLLLNRYPDLTVKAVLQKGDEPGTTDIVLKVSDKMPLHSYVDFNNFGSRYISEKMEGLTLSAGNIVMQGSNLTVRFVAGNPVKNLKFAKFIYDFPINSYNTKLGFAYTWSEFDVQREFRELDSGGNSEVYSLNLTHPLIRNRKTSSDVSLSFDYAETENYLLGQISSKDSLRVLRLGYNLDHTDGFQGRNFLDTKISWGLDIMGATGDDDDFLSRYNAGSSFTKFNLDFNRVQQLPLSTYALVKLSAQATSDSLPVYEQMSIGGPYSVRGYPQSEFLGDYGYNTTLELRFPIPFIKDEEIPFLKTKWKDFMQFAFFVDHAGVYLKNPQPGEAKDDYLTGMGAGLRFSFPWDMTVNIDYGIPLGRDPSSGAESVIYVQVTKKLF